VTLHPSLSVPDPPSLKQVESYTKPTPISFHDSPVTLTAPLSCHMVCLRTLPRYACVLPSKLSPPLSPPPPPPHSLSETCMAFILGRKSTNACDCLCAPR